MNLPSDPKTCDRARFLDIVIDPVDRKASLAVCCALIEAHRPSQHVVINAGKVVLAHRDPRLAGIISRADLVNADGQSVVWAGRRLGIQIPERVAGIDLMNDLVREAATHDWGIYLLGARPEIVAKVAQRLMDAYPLLRIVGTHHGYFDDSQQLAREIADSGARIVFIAFPSPMKEYFVEENAHLMGPVLAFGVGGSFDVIAGLTKRAPAWMQRIGLEWFYRFLQEPRRMWRRYLLGNTMFVYLVLRQLLGRRDKPLD